MMNILKRVLALVTLIIVFGSCKKKLDDYYKAPDNLAAPIYQQLQTLGNFTKFLALIDKAGYRQTLSAAGYWTMFAPSDSAFNNDADFKTYLQSRGFSSVEAVDSVTALSLVQFLLVYNAFNKDKIDDYQSTTKGYIPNTAFKRRTAYYTGFYNDTTVTGQPLKAIASNRNGFYLVNDNNNKYIPYFTSAYFTNSNLLATDYEKFYPTTSFSGFNVANAKVTQQDITAGNGVIHIIDHVVTPLMSLDQYLRTKPEYSVFRNLIEKFMVSFNQNADATHRYQVLSGSTDNVFVKTYNTLLAFSLNNENYFKLEDNDAQSNGWSMMAPRNDSLSKYINTVLLENYSSVDALPSNVIADLINSHLWQTTLWPSKFRSTNNFLGESAHLDFETNTIDRKVLSNGIFYGTNKVNEPNVFSSVYAKAYLNPRYSFMVNLLAGSDLRNSLINGNKFTLFMIPDAVFRANGYDYNSSNNTFIFTNKAGDFRNDLVRILNSCVVENPGSDMDNLGAPGFLGTGVAATYGGEVVKWVGNQILTAGTIEKNITITVDSFKTAKNGRVIYINNPLYFPVTTTVGTTLSALGTAVNSEYSMFWNYLKSSSAYDATVNATAYLPSIVGVNAGIFYTVFAPNNTAMKAAISAGLLPGTPTVPNYTPTLAADKALVEKFMLYHVIDKKTLIPDKKDVGTYPALLKLSNGDPTTINLQYPGGIFEITDAAGRKAHLVFGATNQTSSNQLSQRTVIHLLDNYLRYP